VRSGRVRNWRESGERVGRRARLLEGRDFGLKLLIIPVTSTFQPATFRHLSSPGPTETLISFPALGLLPICTSFGGGTETRGKSFSGQEVRAWWQSLEFWGDLCPILAQAQGTLQDNCTRFPCNNTNIQERMGYSRGHPHSEPNKTETLNWELINAGRPGRRSEQQIRACRVPCHGE